MSNTQSSVNNTPLAKMSKKQRKEYFSSYRGSWGQISPVTRKPQNPKAYNRKKSVRQFLKDTTSGLYFVRHIQNNCTIWQI